MNSRTDKNLHTTKKSLLENTPGTGNILFPGLSNGVLFSSTASRTDRFRTPQPFSVPGISHLQKPARIQLQQGSFFNDYLIVRRLSHTSLTFLVIPKNNTDLQNNPDTSVLQLFPKGENMDEFLLAAKKLSAMSSLQKPEEKITPQLLGYGVDDSGYGWLITKYVEQPSLEYFIQAKAPLNEHKALFTIYKIAELLHKAFPQWGPHGKLAPSKILFAMKKPPLLLGMGVMRFFIKNKSTVFPDETFFYSSPEYIMKEELSQQSDIYSLGIIFYRLLSGVLPFYAENADALKEAHLQEILPPLSGKNLPVRISTLTQEILDKMTMKDPAERFSTYRELLETLIKADDALPQEMKE